MKPDLSIIICTRNRADSLRPTLESIGRTTIPSGKRAELLVVDNGSTDHTKTVVHEVQLNNLELRYVKEPKPGVSHAKNTGLRETSGDIILFTDDDLRVPLNWIDGMCRPILSGESDAVAGGVIFPREIDETLSVSPMGSRRSWVASTSEIDPVHPHRMVGANMAFHRRVLEKVPGFDVELGPGALGFNEETLFSKQLLVAGYKIASAFDVAVEHHFDVKRLTREAALDTARKMGRSHAFLFYHWEHRRSHLILPRLIKCRLQRFWINCFTRLGGSQSTVWPQVVLLEEEQAFTREYLAQRNRRPKYTRHGLVALYSETAH